MHSNGLSSFNRRKQNIDYVSTAREIEKSQGTISFKTMSAADIFHRLNAFQYWPGISFKWQNSVIKIHQLSISNEQTEPGTVKIVDNVLRVGTTTNAIDILELQPENKKAMSCKDFINGKKGIIPGTIEEL
jgi:methionyl-tRNA formyltransferase